MEQSIEGKINQRRRQFLVHSFLYYRMDKTIISDEKFDKWARELYSLQLQYPEIAEQCIEKDYFRNFDPASGFDIPYLPWVENAARRLLQQ